MQMLLDHARVDAFCQAIVKSVRPGSTVVDAGTGSGVLAIIAAQAGARHVLALDIDPNAVEVARQNVELTGFSDVVEVIEADAADICLQQPVDVVICEMLHSWLVEEMQAPVIGNLRSYLRPGASIIPEAVENSVALASVEFVQPDLPMLAPFHCWQHEDRPRHLGHPVIASIECMADLCGFRRRHGLAVQASSQGTANAVALDSRALFAGDHWLGQTRTLFPTIYVPLQSAVAVTAGLRYELTIDFELGGRWTQITAQAVQL
jgi:predicted RNA methylase